MARLANALRLALGAATGALEGARVREEVARQRKLQEDALSRQTMMDTLSLVQAGAMPTAKRWAVAQEGTSAIGNAIASAMNVAGGGPAIPFDAGAIQRGAGRLGAPAAQFTVGGTSYDIPSMQDREAMALAGTLSRKRAEMGLEEEQRRTTAQEQARLAAANEQQLVDAYIALGMKPAQARAAAKAKASYESLVVTPAQRLQAETTRRGQDITREVGMARIDQEKTPANEIEKRLPVGARNDIADYNAAIRTLQEAEREVASNPGAFGLEPAFLAKGGAVGRMVRERREGAQSEAYTKARAQMQSALMKLRKTQFGTQMTRLEKETGEEVFPSGAESPQRLAQMLTVLVGNAEQLRRGVYEANNAADLYQPIAPAEKASPPATPTAQSLEQEFPDKAAQIQRARASGYTDAQIRARLGGR